MPTPVRLVSLTLVLALPLAACGTSHSSTVNAADQLQFGVDMARRGLWSEAFFRFQQAQRLEGGTDAKVLGNLAVSSEALGKFDQALDYYKQALAITPGEPELKANYDRFVSFYESFRARGEEGKDGKPAPAAAQTDARRAGEGRPTTPEPPSRPGLAEPPGLEPPDVPPLLPPEPQPTPPMTETVALPRTASPRRSPRRSPRSLSAGGGSSHA